MKVLKYVLTLFIYNIFTVNGSAQSVGDWKSHTSFYNASGVSVDELRNNVWVGTTGGIFKYDLQTAKLKTWSNTEGLAQTHVTSVFYDTLRKGLWIGYHNGTISFFLDQHNQFSHLYSLSFIDEIPEKSILNFASNGDSVFAATAFGLVLIDPKKNEIREVIKRIGTFSEGIACGDLLIWKNHLYALTEEGLAIGDLSALNILAPNAWKMVLSDSIDHPQTITRFKDFILIGAQNGLFHLEEEQFKQVPTLHLHSVVDMLATQDSLFILTENALVAGDTTLTFNVIESNVPNARQIAYGNKENRLWIASDSISLISYSNGGFDAISPKMPKFNAMAVLGKDHLNRMWISSSATKENAIGLCYYHNNQWISLDSIQPQGTNRTIRQFTDLETGQGVTYFGTWGQGLMKLSGEAFFGFDQNNSTLIGTKSDSSVIIIPALAGSTTNNVWMTNYLTQNGPLQRINADDSFEMYGSEGNAGKRFPDGMAAYKLAIDELNQKWIVAKSESDGKGLGAVVFLDNNTPDELSDDVWITINQNAGLGSLPDKTINDIAVDREGSIWLATNRGLAYFFDANSVSPGFIEDVIVSPFLESEALMCLAIDGLNRKWVGSSNGVWLLNPDASQILTHYTQENSPLLSNTILDIYADQTSGMIYFGTYNGLSVLQTQAIQEKESLSGKLNVFPNPFTPGSSTNLTIDGLGAQASVKILTVSGKLVKTLTGIGSRQLSWDGKTDSGDNLPTGIYLVVAISEDGSQSAIGKLAIINKRR